MNERVKIQEIEILSKSWYVLKQIKFQYLGRDGQWQQQSREAYDRGNGATILLYNPMSGTVILTRQFRMPTYLNGNESGMLIETCAGLLDKDNAEDAVRRETEEETGYKISDIRKVFECYMSPGSVTELLFFFVAEYGHSMKVNDGGGAKGEQENIEVMELPFEKAYAMIETGEIRDGKTIMLLQFAKIQRLLG